MTLPEVWRRPLAIFLLLLAALLWLYRSTAWGMVDIWYRSETFAHGFVVLPISLWLIWRQRQVLATLTPRTSPVFVVPMALAALLWLVADLAAVNAATQFAFVAMLVLLVPAVLGWPVARSITFPLGFLFFGVPFGDFMLPQLMDWTAAFTVAAVRGSGVPVYQEGLQFVIPTGNWSVIEACSGIRYLIASTMVGALFAYLNYRTPKRRWIFVGVSILLPLVANWLRAYMIVMIGHLSGNKLATGVDHLIYGWVFFGIVMLALFMIGARWAEPDEAPPTQQAASGEGGRSNFRWSAVCAVVAVLAMPVLAARHFENGYAGEPKLAAPDLVAAGWRLGASPLAEFKPAFENARDELSQVYQTADGARVGLYAAYYHQQSYRSKLVSSDNVLVRSNDKLWALAATGFLQGDSWSARTAELRGDALTSDVPGRRLRAWQLYWVNGHWTASDWRAKLHGVLGRLTGQGDDGAILVIYADKTQVGAEDALLARFFRDNQTALNDWLLAVRNGARDTGGLKTGIKEGK